MGTDTGFMEYDRSDPGYRPVEERLRDYRDVALHLSDEDIGVQATRCMDCGIPFCHGYGCPVTNMIPEFNDNVSRGRWEEALNILLATNPFPEFTGRICPAPCETSCVLGINKDPVTIREIELAVIEHAFQAGLIRPQVPEKRREERIAVLGSGPSGLAAAYVLNRNGFNVVVYENNLHPGGILRYGIPDFKLEKSIVERRVDLMREEGVAFETGVEIGEDISYRFLKSRFDAMLLTGGASQPRDLNVEGRELEGIYFAMDFLTQQNKRVSGEGIGDETPILAEGKNVMVIGGGDTGSDCVGTSIRHGAKSVIQFEIMPKPPPKRSDATPWPLWPNMLRESSSHKEGCERRWSVSTKNFTGSGGSLSQLTCVEIDWVTPPEGGRPSPVEREGSEFTVDADMVLLAMGFVGPGHNRLVQDRNLELDGRGLIKRDENRMTSEEGIFVAGDMARGASLVVRAIQDGKIAAQCLARYFDSK
jgi:glutamate synthase (NADPH/NADH) small chain